jgi:tryptophanyl-tRNA synthetase
MAADIMLYKAELVPVGVDQEPHLEVTREIVRKFNSMFGETFPEPQRFATTGEYVPSLSGEGKMSKSVEGSYITLMDDLDTIKKRLASAPTDSGIVGGRVPETGGVANLFTMLKLFGTDEMYNNYVTDYEEKRIRYGDMKHDLAEAIAKELKPLQEKRRALESDPTYVDQVLEKSQQNCLERASETIREVKEKMGLVG